MLLVPKLCFHHHLGCPFKFSLNVDFSGSIIYVLSHLGQWSPSSHTWSTIFDRSFSPIRAARSVGWCGFRGVVSFQPNLDAWAWYLINIICLAGLFRLRFHQCKISQKSEPAVEDISEIECVASLFYCCGTPLMFGCLIVESICICFFGSACFFLTK